MSSPFIPIKTAAIDWRDNLPFCQSEDVLYFSIDTVLAQSRNVFIDGNNLIKRWLAMATDETIIFNVAETAFGAGINFLLTWCLWSQYAPQNAKLHFISCEKNPFHINDLIKSLNNFPELAQYSKQLIDKYPVLTPGYHHLSFDDGRVMLTLMLGDVQDCFEQLLICGESSLEFEIRTAFIDAWYLDDSSPHKKKELWSDSLFKIIAMLSKEGTTLAIYSSAVELKRRVQEVGFIIEQKKGSDEKRPMISACFKQLSPCRLRARHTPWHVSNSLKQPQKKSVIIIGAGLAGSFTAYSLARRGWQVTVIDELETAGKGGSGNQQAILFPNLSSYKSPLAQFMLSAFIYASQLYKVLLRQYKIGELKGSLLLAHNEKEQKVQQSLKSWLHHYPELGELVDNKRSSDLAGLILDKQGLFIPLSGWINSPDLCKELLKKEGITLLTNYSVDSLTFDKEQWRVGNIQAPVLVLANGSKVNSFEETQNFPITPICGQMTEIKSTVNSSNLMIPICADGHVLPEINGIHRLGATYHSGITTPTTYAHDDLINLLKLKAIGDETIWSDKVVDHWAGIRASTPDYLPLVGQIPNAKAFMEQFSGLASDSKRWIAKAGTYYQGLYVCAGFGSRGLTTIPLCAEWLAATINNEISCLPRNLVQALSPARFLKRDLTRGSS